MITTCLRVSPFLAFIVTALALLIVHLQQNEADDVTILVGVVEEPPIVVLGAPIPNATFSATSVPSAKSMVPVVWNDNNEATIEFCQEDYNDTNGSRADIYGYRLPGEEKCRAAGIIIRLRPGEDYTLILHNAANESTNLHTHGLHISGAGNADDVTRFVEPSMCLQYKWSLSADHMGGTFWIHSHQEGLVKEQVSGGAFAMLIVEETETVLDNIVNATSEVKEGIQQWMNNELHLVASSGPQGSTAPLLGNGKEQTRIEMVANEWYRLRVLTVHSNGRRIPIEFPQECNVHVAAWDGVWRFKTPARQADHFFQPTGAGRMDLAIRCPEPGELPILFGEDEVQVAILNVVEGEVSNATPFLPGDEPWEPFRPYYLRDLSNGDRTIGDFENFTISLTGRKISGFHWQKNTPFMQVEYNKLLQWTIQGSGFHSFHIHVFNGQTFGCDGHEDGEYYDTISSTNNECRIRFHVVDFGDRVVCHCHNVLHENEGMMVWFQVNNGPLQSDVNREEVICSSMYHGHQ